MQLFGGRTAPRPGPGPGTPVGPPAGTSPVGPSGGVRAVGVPPATPAVGTPTTGAPETGARAAGAGVPGPRTVPTARPTAPVGTEVVTGEGVVVDLHPASVPLRALAKGIDAVLLFALLLGLVVLLFSLALDADEAALQGLVVSIMVGVFVVVPAVVEALTRGSSPGKAALGLRVVRLDGGPVRLRQCVVRALMAVFEVWGSSGGVAACSAVVSRYGQTFGDLLAGTYVQRERTGTVTAGPAVMPAHLAAWAVGADIAPLPDALALAARQYLSRAARLTPQARLELGAQLAGEIARRVAPLPPVPVGAEEFIAAVLVERRRRDLQRLSRIEQARLDRAARRARQAPGR